MSLEEIKKYILANKKPLIIGAVAALVIRSLIK